MRCLGTLSALALVLALGWSLGGWHRRGPLEALGSLRSKTRAASMVCQERLERFLSEHPGRPQSSISPEDAAWADWTDPHPRPLLFFLHVPRTAGTTYWSCLLRRLTPPSRRCASSYDAMRHRESTPDCTLLASHDDWSAVEDLTLDQPPSVVTLLRSPLERVISAYEFAVDVAAQRIGAAEGDRSHAEEDHLHSTTSAGSEFSIKGLPLPSFSSPLSSSLTETATAEVWPWSRLVPWFEADMRSRMERLVEKAREENDTSPWTRVVNKKRDEAYYWNRDTNESAWELPPPRPVLNAYDNVLVTPLREWIELPVARDTVHEAATLMLLGWTPASSFAEEDAGALRDCIFREQRTTGDGGNSSSSLSKFLARVQNAAQARLSTLAHVSVYERLEDGVRSLAALLGASLEGPAWRGTDGFEGSFDPVDAEERERELGSRLFPEGGGAPTARQMLETDVLQPSQLQAELEEHLAFLNASDLLAVATASVSEARRAASALHARLRAAEVGQARVLPQLRRLVGQEDAWLAEEERRDAEAAAALVADEGRSVASPWAAEIEALDARLSALQGEEKGVREVLNALVRAGALRQVPWERGGGSRLEGDARTSSHYPPFPTAPHRRFVPTLGDEHYRHSLPLGKAFRTCQKRTAAKSREVRAQRVYEHVRTPLARETFAFPAPASRGAALPEEVELRIMQLNSLDARLWKSGGRLFEERFQRQRAAGLLQELPQVEIDQEWTRGGEEEEEEERSAAHDVEVSDGG